MNARHGVLGPGNRANATIGRAVRLVAMNVLGARPGRVGCLLVRPSRASTRSASPRTRRRRPGGRCTSSSAMPRATRPSRCCRPKGREQIAQQLTRSAEARAADGGERDPEPGDVLDRQGRTGHGRCSGRSTPVLHRAGLDAGDVREFLFRESRIAPEELLADGVQIVKGSAFEEIPDEEGKLRSRGLTGRRIPGHRRRRGRGMVGVDSRTGRRSRWRGRSPGGSGRPASRCPTAGRTAASSRGRRTARTRGECAPSIA